MKRKGTRAYVIKRAPILKGTVFFAIIACFLYIVVVQRDTLSHSVINSSFMHETAGKNYINHTIAFSRVMEPVSFLDRLDSFSKTCLGFSVKDPASIIQTQIAFAAQYQYAPEDAQHIPKATQAPAAGKDTGEDAPEPVTRQETVKIGDKTITNHTDYAVDTAQIAQQGLSFQKPAGKYQVMVLHTHATESYLPNDRSSDNEKNVVKVGDALTQRLNQLGIQTLHVTTHHDEPSYNGSYGKSAVSVENYLKKYPEIQIVIDLHRDAIVSTDGGKLGLVTEIEKKPAAQMMLVVGTNAGGLEHPNWQKNLCFALKLQQKICEQYPTLMRAVDLRKERFNQNLLDKYVIVEVGANGNNLSDAVSSTKYLADALANLIHENTK